MKIADIITHKYVKSSLLLIAGLFLGWLFFHNTTPKITETQTETHEQSDAEKTIWTCAMHPQIKMDKPGLCPICGMELIPLKKSNAEIDDAAIEMSESALKLAEVQTSIVGKSSAEKELMLYGKIQANEKLLQSQTAHFSGRVEKLLINVTGETVKSGQLVAQIYSPDLISAQKELLEAISLGDKYPVVLEAAREKLRNWKLSEKQIEKIESTKKIESVFNVFSNTSGIVTTLKIKEGDYITKGSVLYDVSDLSKVWAVFDAYESDLPWISMQQTIKFTTEAVPGKVYEGKVTFIDPVMNPNTRIARVRIAINNADGKLKPDMFVNGIANSEVKKGNDQLSVPKSAVLWTGKRSIVYVKIPNTEQPTFKMREITLGASMKDSYLVVDGLETGEEIVTNGTFSVDAASQLAGKPSMMNQSGGPAAKPHDMSKMDKGGDEVKMGSSKPASVNETQAQFTVAGNCEMCKERIENAAKSVTGVSSANWNANDKKLSVSINSKKLDIMEIHKAIAAVGHDTELVKAPKEVYEKLPGCCLYDRP